MNGACPCGSGKALGQCCGPYLEGAAWPEDAESLMRSRYTAYGCGRFDWLVESTHPDHREGVSVEGLAQSAEGVRWLRLDVKDVRTNVPSEDSAQPHDEVDFYAYYELEGVPRQLAERSAFSRKDGKLYYAGGVSLRPAGYRRAEAKVGRNDPCPCGSGKKYKKCCGAAPLERRGNLPAQNQAAVRRSS